MFLTRYKSLGYSYPELRALSDFKNGYYETEGVEVTLADQWVQNAAWSSFNSGTDIVAGTGLTKSGTTTSNMGPVSTAALFAAVGGLDGFTVVADVVTSLTGGGGLKPRILVSIVDLPGYAAELDFIIDENNAYFEENYVQGTANQVVAPGTFRIAVTLGETSAYSINGGAVQSEPVGIDLATVESIALWLLNYGTSTGSDTATATIERLAFYAAQNETYLPALSAIPEAVAISDFKNGTYSINGNAKTLADMWDDPPPPYTYSPMVVTPGTGLIATNTDAGVSMAPFTSSWHTDATELWNAICGDAEGFTFVVDYNLAASGNRYAFLLIGIEDHPDANSSWNYSASFSTDAAEQFRKVRDYNGGSDQETETAGAHRAAVTLAPGFLAMSVDGGPVRVYQNPMGNSLRNQFYINAIVESGAGPTGTATSIVERIDFYEAQPPTQLRALSLT